MEGQLWSRSCTGHRPALTWVCPEAVFSAVITKTRHPQMPDHLVSCLSLRVGMSPGRTVFLCNVGSEVDFLGQRLQRERERESTHLQFVYHPYISAWTLTLWTLFSKFLPSRLVFVSDYGSMTSLTYFDYLISRLHYTFFINQRIPGAERRQSNLLRVSNLVHRWK